MRPRTRAPAPLKAGWPTGQPPVPGPQTRNDPNRPRQFPVPGLSSKGRGIKVNPVGQCVGGPEEAKERVFQEAREARKGREQCANDGGTEGHG